MRGEPPNQTTRTDEFAFKPEHEMQRVFPTFFGGVADLRKRIWEKNIELNLFQPTVCVHTVS